MTDRNDRSDRLRKRFDRGDEDVADAVEADDTDSAEPDSSSTSDGNTSVKDRPSVLMYLPEEVHDELDIRFDELNAQYKRTHGESLQKNRHYYPAVIQAGLEDRSVESILGLE